MKHIRNRNILELPGIESWRNQLSEKKVEMLEKSWAGTFREHVTPHLAVEKLAFHYSDDMGRKTKELTTVMGTILFQQIFDLTDEQTRVISPLKIIIVVSLAGYIETAIKNYMSDLQLTNTILELFLFIQGFPKDYYWKYDLRLKEALKTIITNFI